MTTGAYRAVEFIKKNIRLDGVEKASVSDSKKVVAICTQYAQKGMFNIFLAVFFEARSSPLIVIDLHDVAPEEAAPMAPPRGKPSTRSAWRWSMR